MSTDTATQTPHTLTAEHRTLGPSAYLACFNGIVWREVLRYLHQRERFLSALVRPLVWLFGLGYGLRNALGMPIQPPYETYIPYELYMVPGLVGMILLFNAMQSSLSMVYDRETGAMRTLLVSPFPRWFLLISKLFGGVTVSLLQVYAFLGVTYLLGIDLPYAGYISVVPALILGGLMLGSIALFLSSVIKQLENFAGVMNYIIFPMIFFSTALGPLWRMKEGSEILWNVARFNPFTHVIELVRFGFYGQVGLVETNGVAYPLHLIVVVGCTVVFLLAAIYAYNPSKGLIGRRGGPGGTGG
jgi:ABC-2 type transport system permease protein